MLSGRVYPYRTDLEELDSKRPKEGESLITSWGREIRTPIHVQKWKEGLATHHIQKFRDAGGSEANLQLAFRLAGGARSSDCFAFVANEWSGHFADFDREAAYREGLKDLTARAEIESGLVEMAMAAAHTCKRAWTELAWHIRGAYAERVDEYELAEAISYAMFPGSIPNFVDACGVWLQLIRDGEVSASEAFLAWAQLDGQGGFDEASGVAGS